MLLACVDDHFIYFKTGLFGRRPEVPYRPEDDVWFFEIQVGEGST